MNTPHICANEKEISKVVILTGDPLRAKWITENFLTGVKLVNTVRGMYGFTGKYKNKNITVMGHGMGMGSIGIYSYELFKFFNVNTIIRIGSCGSCSNDIKMGDVIIAKEAFSYSAYPYELGLKTKSKILKADKILVNYAVSIAKKNKFKYHACRIQSTDAFYNFVKNLKDQIKWGNQSKAIEMEAFALYANALKLNKKALTILTCSDEPFNHVGMSSKDRQTKFKEMVLIALELSHELL